ncbi:MAG: hypothetical protein ABII27_01595 [bacterium]
MKTFTVKWIEWHETDIDAENEQEAGDLALGISDRDNRVGVDITDVDEV